MSALCIGGVCIPYSAILPFFALGLKWLVEKLSGWGLLPSWLVGDSAKKSNNDDDGDKATKRRVSDKSMTLRSVVDDHEKKDTKEIIQTTSSEKETVQVIQDVEHWQKVVLQHPHTIVMMTATWCRPCKTILPFFNDLAAQWCNQKKGAVSFCFVDVDELDTIANEYKISMMPTFLVLREGKQVDKYSGSDAARLRQMLERHLEAKH